MESHIQKPGSLSIGKLRNLKAAKMAQKGIKNGQFLNVS
jgi:hypothetical protein